MKLSLIHDGPIHFRAPFTWSGAAAANGLAGAPAASCTGPISFAAGGRAVGNGSDW